MIAEDSLTAEDNNHPVELPITTEASTSREGNNPSDFVQPSVLAGISCSRYANSNTPAQQSSDIDSNSACSRFQAISFKEMLKAKGRPKRKNRQVKFRKTAIDGKDKTGKEEKRINVGRKGGKHRANAFKALVLAEHVTGCVQEEDNVDDMSVDKMAVELLDLPCLDATELDGNENTELNSTTIDTWLHGYMVTPTFKRKVKSRYKQRHCV